MEQGVLIEGPHRELGSAHASRSSQSQTMIDSITINFDDCHGDDSKCDHFSIRGLTAKMRKKNGSLCWPFEVDGKENVSEEIIAKLPPLVVPSFRYWRCKTCLHDASVNGAVTCCSYDGNERREVQATTDANRKKDAVALESKVINHVNGLTHEMNMEVPQASDVGNSDPIGMLRMHEDISAVERNGTGLSEKTKMNSTKNTIADSVVAIGNTICLSAKDSYTRDQPNKLVKSSETSSIDRLVNRHQNAASDRTRVVPTLEIDSRNASSEADENLDRELVQDQHHEETNGARKKTRKVRLLTELLKEKGSANAGQSRKNNALPKESDRTGADSVSPSVVVTQGNTGSGIRGLKKKKKKHMPNDPEWKHPKVTSPHKFKMKYKGDGETSNARSKFSKDDATMEVGKEGSAKRINHGADGHPITQEETNKNLDESECLISLFPSQEAGNISKIRTGNSDVNAAADAAVVHSVASRVADPLVRRILPSDKYEKESSLPVGDDILLQIQDLQASSEVRNSGMQEKHSVTMEQSENIQIGPVSTPFPLALDDFSKKGSFLSLNSFLDAQKNTCNSVSHTGYDLNLVRPIQHAVSRVHAGKKHDGLSGVQELNSSCKSASDTNIWKRVYTDSDINRATHGTSSTNEKKDYHLPYVGTNSFKSSMLLQDLTGKSKNVKMDRVQEHLVKQHTSQGSENAFETGAMDDIPMEIVELLAKNQYERRLNEAKSSQRYLETTSKRNSGSAMDYARLNKDAALKPSRKHRAWLESQDTGTRNDKPTRGELSTNQPENRFPQWSPLGDFGKTYSLPQSNQLRAVAPIGSSRLDSRQKGKFDGDLLSLGHSHSPSSLHAFKPYEACQNSPQHSEKAIGIFSPLTQNHLSYTQNHAAASFNKDLLPKSPSQVHKQNVNGGRNLRLPDLNFTEGEKQNRSYNSGASEMDAENSYSAPGNRVGIQSRFLGAKDNNSNEAVSAMYLLSLMDSARSTPPSLSLDSTSKFLKKPSFPHHHQVKELQKVDFGVCKDSHNPSQPSFNYKGNQKLSGMSCQCSPIPTIDAIASCNHHNESSRSAASIPSQNRLTSHEKGKSKLLYPPSANSGSKPWKSAFSPVVFAPTYNTSHVNGIERNFFSAPQPIGGSSKGLTIGYPFRTSNLVPNSPSEPGKRSSETEICTVNRNPADFSAPGPGNIYMTGAEDLRRKKSTHSRDNSDTVKSNSNGQKRQRITKTAAAKEWVRHQIS